MAKKPPKTPTPLTVAQPPPRPLLLWDGDCRFCAGWIRRWQARAGDRVDFAKYQEAAARFPEINRADLAQAVHLVQPDGAVLRGAEAALAALAPRFPYEEMLHLHRRWGWFRRASEGCYRFVAQRRMFFSWVTRIFWGDPAPPTFRFSGTLFARLTGLVLLIALLSFWAQAGALVGEDGLIPLSAYFNNLAAAAQFPDSPGRFWEAPSFLWFAPDDAGLRAHFLVGTVCALLAVLGFFPAPALLGATLAYASLRNGVPLFLNYQWDALLIETGVAAALLAPWRWWEDPRAPREPPRAARWLAWGVLFKLMLLSGLVKILTNGGGPPPAQPGAFREWLARVTDVPVGENRWLDGTALDYHYFTQPIPAPTSWWFHQLPDWFQAWSLWGTMAVELAVPLLFFGPRRVRHCAAVLQILLQLALVVSGNYGFFNVLTIVLCVPLLDDNFWPARVRGILARHPPRAPRVRWAALTAAWVRGLLVGALLAIAGIQFWECWQLRSGHIPAWLPKPAPGPAGSPPGLVEVPLPGAPPPPLTPPSKLAQMLNKFSSAAQRLGIANAYGLFRVMTTERPEIMLLGSDDGATWKRYEFYFKPGDPARLPRFTTPHMPRLDWQMWFAGLELYYSKQLPPWLPLLLEQISRGNPAVLALFEDNPFPEQPPRFLRIELYRYTFTSSAERAATGDIWKAAPEPQFTLTGERRAPPAPPPPGR